MNKIKEKIRSEGIVHFWDLPHGIHVILNPEFKSSLMRELMKIADSRNKVCEIIDIPKTTFRRYLNNKSPKIRIDYLLKFIGFMNDNSFRFQKIEERINWIGNKVSQGITDPKLPFNFNSRAGARFLAAICNDGYISDNMYYCNNDKKLRNSIRKDALSVFGGRKNVIKTWIKENDQYLSFPSIMRDVVILIADFKGEKSVNNPAVPPFIMNEKEFMCGWIEQTIADEGCVKHYPKSYRREIMWKRAFKSDLEEFKLNVDEITMLKKLGVKCWLYNVGRYKTKKGIKKTMLLIRIAKRENLLRLRDLIKIPHNKKDLTLTKITKSFLRYKEPILD